MKGHADLRLATTSAVICAIVAVAVPVELISLAFAAPLTLFLPGYALASASFARRPLPRAQRLVVYLALSLCSLALGSLLLNYTPGGIQAASWAIFLPALVAVACLVAARRRGAAAGPQRLRARRPRGLAVALSGAGLAAAVAALILAATTFPVKSAVGHTQLWVLPADENPDAVEVGIGNQEQNSIAFYLAVRIGDQKPIRRSFSLDPGETKIVEIDGSPIQPGEQLPVVATLLRQDRIDKIDLRVRSWVPVAEENG